MTRCVNFSKSTADNRKFYDLFMQKLMVDVTLSAEGSFIQAHKVVLAVASTFFEELFELLKDKEPVIVLKDCTLDILNYVLEYIYLGTVNIPENDAESFVNTLKSLRINIETSDNDPGQDPEETENVERVEEEVPGQCEVEQNFQIKSEPEWDSAVIKEEPAVKEMPPEGLLKVRTPASINENIRVKLNETSLKNLKLVNKLPAAPQMSTNIQEISKRLSKAILIRRVKKSDGSIVSQRRPVQIVHGMKIQKISSQNGMPGSGGKGTFFKCQYCSKAFVVNKRRNAHQKYCFKNPERPSSQCPYCPMVLCNPTYIQTHIRKVHGIDENGEVVQQ